jgi:hypothetical protein
MKAKIALVLLLAIGVPNALLAYTVKGKTQRTYQTDGSQADAQRAIDAAPDDGSAKVTVPAGTFDWSESLVINKAVTLAGSDTTIRNRNASTCMISAISGKRGNIVIYGFRIEQAVGNNTSGHAFMIHAGRDESTRHTVLIHNCHFDEKSIFNYSIEVGNNGIIIWGCSFIGSGSPAVQGLGGISFVCNHADYQSYNRPSTMGTLDPDGVHNSYVEDCSFKNAATGVSNFDSNARAVWRHNVHQDAALSSHGMETSPQGCTHWEIYDCTFRITPDNPYDLNYWFQARGGTGVITNNDLDAIPRGKSQFQLNVFAITRSFNDGYGGAGCPLEYPCPRQTGWSWADNGANWGKVEDSHNPQLLEHGKSPGYFLPIGKGAKLDPVYVWHNRGAGTKDARYVDTQTYMPDNCGNGKVIDTYLQKGRDYIVDQGPKPGWTPYPYPHPLRNQLGGGGPGPSPRPTPAPTATPTPGGR